ncbi:plant stearoyl-acyl-carrier-protein desaturasefamily protein [Striga asiatica]|uniref:Plant stearoyl-acyl-carrier-protein desaturasefamily protein n=1 Tax=Striga asiatica TaxID=4170 RepID=A0A5A7Q7Z8_STRAF|nr:plant stearoyl-acyl-carrier-protein desaturasefamily protein [Striga asiatica]
MRKPKRVRFVGDELGSVPVRDSPERHEATAAESPRSDDAPKTSEFAYFRKVKSRVIHGHSCSLGQENGKLKIPKISSLIKETNHVSDISVTHTCTKDFKCSDRGERAGPSDPNLFLSPRVEKTDKNQNMLSSVYENDKSVGQSLLLSPAHEASEDSENEYGENRIFSAKRRRLQQWAAHTLFPETEKPVPKGFDFVSALMNRLFPKNNGDNDISEREANNSSKSLILHKSNPPDKGLHLSHKWDWNKYITNTSPGRPNGIIISEPDALVSQFPSHNYVTETLVQNFPDQHPRSRIHRSANAQHGFSFFLPFDRYRQAESCHFKITDCPRTECVRPLVEWDFHLGKDEAYSPIFNREPERNLYSGFSSSWTVDENRTLGHVLDSRSFPNYFVEFDSLPNTGLDLEANFKDVKSTLIEPGQFSLALPSTPRYITLGEDTNAGGNIICDQNMFFSYSDHQWLQNKPQSEFWQKDSLALDFYAEDYPSTFHAWQFPENESNLSSLSKLEADARGNLALFSGGLSFNRNSRSYDLQPSLDRLMNRPLLLDHISRERSGQELFCNVDDDDD